MENERDQPQQNLLEVDIDSTVAKGKKLSNHKRVIIVVAVVIFAVGMILFLCARGTAVDDIVFSDNEVEVVVGETLELNYTILPDNATNKNVRWESSDIEIVEVDDTGVITARRKGTVTITATTANGKQDKCLVAVKPTAFEYLKALGRTKNGYTIGNYSASGSNSSYGVYYLADEDSIYIIEIEASESGSHSALASIAIPSSLSGGYKGYLKFEVKGVETATTTYLVDAATFTSKTNLNSFYCDKAPAYASANDKAYTASLQTMLAKVYQEILEPNGYTYADLGFTAYD